MSAATPALPDPAEDLDGKAILVTGATGSFGQRFVQTVLERYRPQRVVVFSRDEAKQHDMQMRFPQSSYPAIRYFIGDVRDLGRLEMAMREIDIVVHAAALKHVPAAEYNPFECVRTNVHGAENVVQAALRTGVRKVLALSTDKAVSPINLYGATKLASDKIFIAANNLSGTIGTRFSIVRYGNVVGSRGSVVQVYRRLIDEGAGSLPVTDPRMTRFWITLQQGVDFVLSCLGAMFGGEIFIPKVPSMRITDLAHAMAPDLPHDVIGIRPGEKLHESLLTEHDARTTVELDDRYIVEPSFAYWATQNYEKYGATTVAEGFHYASDSNPHWLDVENFKEILDHLDGETLL